MLLPMLYYSADVIAFFNVVVVGKTQHHIYGLVMVDVIAFFNDVVVGKTLHHMYRFDNGRCYCLLQCCSSW